MSKHISVIAIDIPSHIYTASAEAKQFASLSAFGKLAVIIDHIDKIMSELDKTEPDILHIVTWREYGISGKDSKFVTFDEKIKIKKILSELANKYPTLVIVAGAMAIIKHFDNYTVEHYSKIKNDYIHLSSPLQSDDEQTILHLKHLEQSRQMTTVSVDESKGINVISNVCYVIQKGKIQQHAKTIPHAEIYDYGHQLLENAVFRPGKGATKNPLVWVEHPNGKDKVCLGIEICYEHPNEVLKSQNKNQLIDLHLILSDFTRVKISKCCSSQIVWIDSYHEPKMMLTQNIKDDGKIKFYCVNGMQEPAALGKPVNAIYPFEQKISDCLINAVQGCSGFHLDYEVLNQLHELWMEAANGCSLKFQLAENLQGLITKLEKHIQLSKSNQFSNIYTYFYSKSPAEKLLDQMRDEYEIFSKEIKPYDPLDYKDIYSIRVADIEMQSTLNKVQGKKLT